MASSRSCLRIVLSGLVALALGACTEPSPSGVDEGGEPSFAMSSGPVLVECPTKDSASASGTVDALGGTVVLRGHSIRVPELAVLVPTTLTVAVPVSNYMEVAFEADGQAEFGFERPVTITISYERCTRDNIDRAPLTVWKIDPETKALLKPMGGTDDKTARAVTFRSDSLSTYAIAQ